MMTLPASVFQRFLLSLSFLLLYKYAFPQYIPFPRDSATWSILSVDYNIYSGDSSLDLVVYEITGDTILGGNGFTELTLRSNPNDQYYFRFDTVTGEAYRWLETAGEEHILYDYSLSIGDTAFSFDFEFGGVSKAVVKAIDTVMIGGRSRKQLTILVDIAGPDTLVKWIEGIGSSIGFSYSGAAFAYPHRRILVCHIQRDSILYETQGSSYNCDSILVEQPLHTEETDYLAGVKMDVLQVSDMTLVLEIESNQDIGNCLLRTLDLSGRVVWSKSVSVASGYNSYFLPLPGNQRFYILSLVTPTQAYHKVITILK